MKEMMYKIAAMQPVVDTDPTTIQKPQRKNVRFSTDPQSVAARLRRERVSEKIRILRRMVPGGSKMDTASMLDEAILYVKFLKKLVAELQSIHPYPRCENADMDTSDWSIFPMSNMDFAAVTASSSVSSTGPAAASSSLGNLFSNTASGLLEENYMAHGVR